jgi:CRISPR/Cas system-associated exonuclease Cas4 (RecB family)
MDFNKMIEKHIRREGKPKEIGRYYPSEIGMCLRKVWYSYKQPRETAVDLTKVFEVGNLLHDFMAEVLRSERNPEVELLKSELPVKLDMKDFLISGRIDDLLLVKESGKEVLVEVKSTKSLVYTDSPKSHNVMQLQLYMHMTGVHNGVLLYVQKDNLQAKSFDIPYSAKEAAEALERFRRLHSFLTKDEMPEPEAKQDKEKKWMCSYCDWREECYGKKA